MTNPPPTQPTIALPPDPSRRFSEAWGGYIVSFCFYLALFVLLSLKAPITLGNANVSPPEPPPLRVQLQESNEILSPAADTSSEGENEGDQPSPSSASGAPTAATLAGEDAPNDDAGKRGAPEGSADATAGAAASKPDPTAPPPTESEPDTSSAESAASAASAAAASISPADPPSVPAAALEDLPPTLDDPAAPDPAPRAAVAPTTPKRELASLSGAPEPRPAPTTDEDVLLPDKSDGQSLTMIQSQADQQKSAEERRRELEAIVGQGAKIKTYNQEVAQRGSDKVGDRLRAASVDQKGKKWLSTTEGLDKGVIRSLRADDVPPRAAEEVYKRYGIKLTLEMVDGNKGGGYSFLNQAKTQDGTYFNRVGHGMYQVFSFGPPAISRMMQLEVEEMKKRGLDPNRTRVIEIEYGIVSVGKGYDLGVRKLTAAPIEMQEGPGAAHP